MQNVVDNVSVCPTAAGSTQTDTVVLQYTHPGESLNAVEFNCIIFQAWKVLEINVSSRNSSKSHGIYEGWFPNSWKSTVTVCQNLCTVRV